MKLEVESFKPHKVYANAKWELNGKTLTEIVPFSEDESYVSSLIEGDNIRLDGEEYHVIERQTFQQSIQAMFLHRKVCFIYKISQGLYRPEPWIEIGEVIEKKPPKNAKLKE